MMKRMGYPPHYAGAIEACTSTGGVLMPPVMGVIAFVMAFMTGIPYATIAAAAAIPAVLYYLGLLVQIDAFAVKTGMKGLTKDEIPSVKQAISDGWPFLFVIAFLVWGLLYMKWEYITPYYSSVALLVVVYLRWFVILVVRTFRQPSGKRGYFFNHQFIDETKASGEKYPKAISAIGTMISQTTALVLPFCFILAGFVFTGLSSQFTSGIVALAGGNVVYILALGVFACYILGTLGMDIVAYIFLAVSMAPAAIQGGNLNTLAVHMFILYYAMLAAITPPVAIAAWVGGAMAGADIMKTGWMAMRLGAVIFFIPIFFIYHPALLLQGSATEILWYTFAAYAGTTLVALGLEGYIYGLGKLGLWARPLLIAGGLGIGWGELPSVLTGIALVIIVVLVGFRYKLWHKKAA
jgi:TRAP transporter 4TM/12TM fusion protein